MSDFFSWKHRQDATSISDFLHLFGQEKCILIRSGKSRGILKTDVCDNHTRRLQFINESTSPDYTGYI